MGEHRGTCPPAHSGRTVAKGAPHPRVVHTGVVPGPAVGVTVRERFFTDKAGGSAGSWGISALCAV